MPALHSGPALFCNHSDTGFFLDQQKERECDKEKKKNCEGRIRVSVRTGNREKKQNRHKQRK